MDESQRPGFQEHFGANAAKYTHSESHAKGRDLGLLLEHLDLADSSVALDVATGTGHTAMALAPRVARVTALDGVSEMLAEAAAAAAARNIANIDWIKGEADRTGLPPASFDVVTCRRAAHHFPDVPAFLGEVRRLLRPGGQLGLADQISLEDESAAWLSERMEKIHDPSHVKAHSAESWYRMLTEAGFRRRFCEVQQERRTLREFLATTTGVEVKLTALRALLASAPAAAREAIGFVDAPQEDGASFIKRHLIVVCV